MKMSQMFKTTLAAAMIMALAVTAGCGGGGDKKSAGSEKVTLKLAHNLPTAHPLAQGMEAFNKKLTEKSNGTITLNIYPSGQLFNDKSMNDAIMSGGIDMGLNSRSRGQIKEKHTLTAIWTNDHLTPYRIAYGSFMASIMCSFIYPSYLFLSFG